MDGDPTDRTPPTEQPGPTEPPGPPLPPERPGPAGPGAAELAPAEPAPEARRRLYREPEEKKVTGLCGGLADQIGADPTVVRLAVVLLALWSQATILAYLIGAVIVPERPATTPRLPAGRNLMPASWAPHLIGLVGLLLFIGVMDRRWWFEPPIMALGLVGVGIWLLVRDRTAPAPAAAPATTATENDIYRENLTARSAERTTLLGEATSEGVLAGPPASEIANDAANKTEDATHPVPVPPEDTSSVPESSAVSADPQGEVPPPVPPWGFGTPGDPASPPPGPGDGGTTRTFGLPTALLGTMLVVGGTCALLIAFGVVDVSAGTLLAAALVAVGLGLVIGAWRGRARGLIGLGLPLAGLLVLSDAADIPLGAGSGERTVVVDEVDELHQDHEMLAGELTLDLGHLPERQRRDEIPTIRAEVAMGSLVVVLPPATSAHVDALLGGGEIRGLGMDGGEESGVHVERDYEIEGREGGDRVRLHLQVGLGEIEVRRG